MFFPVYKGKGDRTGLERRKPKTPKVAGVRTPRLFCVGGEKFGFSRCKAARADETDQKHLLRIFAAATLKKNLWSTFARLRTQSVLVGVLPFKPPKHEKPNRGITLPRSEQPSERQVSPSPSEGRTVPTPLAQPAPAGGALVH